MAIIAMDREMGSRGKDVAAGVAQALKASLILYEIIDHLADRMRVRKSHVVRLLEDGGDLDQALTPDDILPAILSPIEVLELASLPESVVLRGWGATALLRDVGHVIRVRVTAPHAARVANLKARVKNPNTAKIEQEIAYSVGVETLGIVRYGANACHVAPACATAADCSAAGQLWIRCA